MLKLRLSTILMQGCVALTCTLPMTAAFAHAERTAFFPQDRINKMTHPARVLDAQGRPVYRPLLPTPASPRLVVCKKPGGEGVASGKDSASLIKRIGNSGLKKVNEQLLRECQFEHLQAAVDAVTTRGTTIYVLPGLYREEPSIRALEENFGAHKPEDRDFCQAVLARGPGKLSYEEQFRCRFIQNTVAFFGDPDFTDDDCGDDTNGTCAHPETQQCDTSQSECQYYDLQIEGTGEKITDVIFEGSFIDKPGDSHDGQFKYLNGIRADRADGVFLSNFTTQIYEFNAVYAMEVDGYVFDRLLSRWVDEYAYLSFASDHGLYDYTEGYGVADSVQYPGSGADVYAGKNHAQADLRARQATEIRNSKGHHSALGYSGTAGNAPWVHDSEFYKNQTGMATESVFGGHPGMPQDHALWENNKIYSNNRDYYRLVSEGGPCVAKKPRDREVVPPEFRYFDDLPADFQEAVMDRTVVCPPIPFPTGTGMIIAGGNYDVVANNQVFDNWRQGLWLLAIPTLIHKLTDNPQSPLDTIGVAGPIEQNDPTGQISTVNDALGALTDPNNNDAVTTPVFTNHFNRVTDNRFGENPLGETALSQANGVDIWWDNSGTGNCFVGNTSKQGGVSSNLGLLGIMGLPTDCADGDADIIDQLTTARPDRIAEFVDCLNYNRGNPGSKGTCPFFTELTAPANRESPASKVTADQPAAAGLSGALGYFVLHNQSGVMHRLESATVRVLGSGSGQGTLTLVTRTLTSNAAATASVNGNELKFTFANGGAEVPAIHATLFELKPGNTAQADRSGTLVAGLGAGGLGVMLLMMGGLRRRERLLALALLVVGATLAGCNGDGNDDSAEPRYQLTELKFASGTSTGDYSGLPLVIGTN